MEAEQIDLLKQEHNSLNNSINSFGIELTRQIQQIFDENNVILGFPIQQRTKDWSSIENKLKTLKVESILDIQDLCGLRFVLLFKRDIEKVKSLLSGNFKILKEYDTHERLNSDQFGYASFHMIIKMPDKWFDIPTLKGFKNLKAEIQIRTLSQHTWAAASHALQYKSEDNVPKSILRAIYRVSAILEIVDIEFERFLEEREIYIKELHALSSEQMNKIKLNVDSLEKVLDENLPLQNKTTEEPYSDLLQELKFYNIDHPKQLVALIKKHRDYMLAYDKQTAIKYGNSKEGSYFSHAGLLRLCLQTENKEIWEKFKELRKNGR